MNTHTCVLPQEEKNKDLKQGDFLKNSVQPLLFAKSLKTAGSLLAHNSS